VIAENGAVPEYDFSAPPSVIGRIEVDGKPVSELSAPASATCLPCIIIIT